MSTGHHTGHPIRAEHTELLEKLMQDPRFVAAVQAYNKVDDKHDVPFLGGSDNTGRVVYFDRNFANAVRGGAVRYERQPYDPRKFVHIHEAVEGALIRHHGLDYTRAHDLATAAEQHAVEASGGNWTKHQDSMKPWIKRDEKEKITSPPPNLLTVPYRGTPQDKEVEGKKAGSGKVTKASVNYRAGTASRRCGTCSMYSNHTCSLVAGVISPAAVCDRWERK